MTRIKFEDMTTEQLAQLRSEICLNSLYVADYRNSFGFSADSVCSFFDSFVDYICELAKEKYGADYTLEQAWEFDTTDNLEEWFHCYEDFSWVEYDGEESED